MHPSVYLLPVLILTALSATAQRPVWGNEWINYPQTYYRIPVAQPGLYRLTASELRRAGLPATTDPRTLQLFHRGVEQAILVEGETDGKLDPADYVEFVGRGNDGLPDSALYRPASAQPHAYYSLFSDTTAYFLTARLDGQPGKRMARYTDDAYAGLTPEPYHWAEDLRLFTDTYPGWPAGILGKIEYSHFEAGEGYTGPVFEGGKPATYLFTLSNPALTAPPPQMDALLVGREQTSHQIEVRAGPAAGPGRLLGTVLFANYDNARLTQPLTWANVGADGRLLLTTNALTDGPPDRYSVTYLRLRYPQQLTAGGQPTYTFRLVANPLNRSLLDVADVPANARFWDITNPDVPVLVGATAPVAGRVRLVVKKTDQPRTLLMASQPITGLTMTPVRFTSWENRRPTYLIVTHESLLKPTTLGSSAVREYAAYRASAAGGNYDTLTVTMQQLYDQFSYGERHPTALTRWADQLLRRSAGQANRPRNLVLIGQSRSTPGIRRNPRQAALDMVMTYGFPGSDVVFTAGLDGQPANVPAIPTGRINAATPQQVLDYLGKVREFEAQPAAGWRKQVLHLSGGYSPYETTLFRGLVDGYRQTIQRGAMGAGVTTVSKKTDNPVEPPDVARQVNDGVGVITFFGHSGLGVTDLDIGSASAESRGYRNQGKYPLLLINGSATGNFFFGLPTLATDWVLTPNRGAIAAIAQSHLGYIGQLDRYTTNFYALLADSTQLTRSIGQLQQETIRRVLQQTTDGLDLANTQQMVLQGDPAVRLFPFQTPDFAPGDVTVRATNGQPLGILSDSVRVTVVVQNNGQFRAGPLPVRVRRLANDRELATVNLIFPRSVAFRDTLTLAMPNERGGAGRNQFEVTINPAGTVAETDQTNNRAVADVLVPGQPPVLIYPPQSGTVTGRMVRLTAETFVTEARPFDLELDTTARFDTPGRLVQRITTSNRISHTTTLPANVPGAYFWRVREAAASGSTPGDWVVGTFRYAPGGAVSGFPEGQIRRAGTSLTESPAPVWQGGVVPLSVEFTNLSQVPFADSLTVQQTIYAAGLANPQVTQWRINAPAPGDTVRFTRLIFTDKLPGTNRVVITVNPRLQPEHSFLNNTLSLQLPVLPDNTGPLLEVAIDGQRIADGAVVSARPVIDVLVADDNPALPLRDTTGVALFLRAPGTNTFQRVSWRAATVLPAPDGTLRVRCPLPQLVGGRYELLATARDRLGNPASPYRVGFRVVDTTQLTDLTVFPNPFRDEVRFAVQLTGQQPPTTLRVFIYDLAGRLVRQLAVLAGVRIGLNELVWDGRSSGGHQLPPGLYTYRLDVGDPDQPWPVADATRTRLTGRIVLVR